MPSRCGSSSAAGDEHVGLALHEPAGLHRRPSRCRSAASCRRRRSGSAAGSPRAARRRYSRRRARYQSAAGRRDQGPDAEPGIGAGERGQRAERRGDQIDPRLALEIEPADQQRMAERGERIGEEEQRLDPQQIGDHRLVEIAGGKRRRGHCSAASAAVHQDQHAEGLADPDACRSSRRGPARWRIPSR